MVPRTRANPPAARPAERGFTLVELMVVIVILGGLVTIVGVNVFQALGKADVNKAEQQMTSFANAISMYKIQHRKLPSSLEALTEADPQTGEPLIESVPDDPWGNPYVLKDLGSGKFQIRSAGKDGQEGTDDDIVWPKEKE